jgi:hypothetical protein
MRFFVRAVVYGFALSLGSALFKKVQDRIGLGEGNKDKKPDEPTVVPRDGATEPKLQS